MKQFAIDFLLIIFNKVYFDFRNPIGWQELLRLSEIGTRNRRPQHCCHTSCWLAATDPDPAFPKEVWLLKVHHIHLSQERLGCLQFLRYCNNFWLGYVAKVLIPILLDSIHLLLDLNCHMVSYHAKILLGFRLVHSSACSSRILIHQACW